MRKRDPKARRRVQAYLSDAAWSALERDAKARSLSLSQAASDAIARGLRRSLPGDPDDRLLLLERRLSDHMRLTARDLQISQEMLFALARLLLTRMPEIPADGDPLSQAAVELRLSRLLDDVAAKISAGGTA